MKNVMKCVVVVLVLGSLTGAIVSCAPAATPTPTAVPVASPTATAAPTAAPTPTMASSKAPKSIDDLQRITPEDLKVLIEGRADIVVVDANPKAGYDFGHIPGAVNLPWETKIGDPGNLPKDKLLILYCPCAHEEDAGDVAMQLIQRFGYKNIMLLQGGSLRWAELEYPLEKGD